MDAGRERWHLRESDGASEAKREPHFWRERERVEGNPNLNSPYIYIYIRRVWYWAEVWVVCANIFGDRSYSMTAFKIAFMEVDTLRRPPPK
jgi:hypothetical protein